MDKRRIQKKVLLLWPLRHRSPAPDLFPADEEGAASHIIILRVLLQELRLPLQPLRERDVVRVHPRKESPLRMPDALVESVSDPAVHAAFQIPDPRIPLCQPQDPLPVLPAGTVIVDQKLPLLKRLAHHRFHRLLKLRKRVWIEHTHDHAHLHSHTPTPPNVIL